MTIVVFPISIYSHELRVGTFYAGDAVVDLLVTGGFIWLALTSDRWWALIMSGVMALTLLVYVSALAVPDLGPYAVMSARVGLGILSMLTLLCGVGERWLAGEAATSDRGTWARRHRGHGPGTLIHHQPIRGREGPVGDPDTAGSAA